MARVPQYQGGRVLPNVAPGTRVQSGLSMEAAALPGQQIQGLAQGVRNAGNAAGDFARIEQDKINKVRFNDAYNQAQDRANALKNEYTALLGAEAVKGVNGRSLKDHYRDKLSAAFSEITNGLSAPDVRDSFSLASDEMAGKFLRDVENWEVAQGQVYADQVRDATVITSFDQIAADPLNTELVRLNMDRAKDALRDKLMDAGYEGDALDQQMKSALSKSHNVVIDRLLMEDDIVGARQYFAEHRDDYLELDAKAVPEQFQRKEAELRRKRYESLSLGITQDTIRPNDLSKAYENGQIDDSEYNSLLVQSANAAARKDAERKAKISEWRDQNYALLQVGISDGTMSRADADLALEKGAITWSQWSQAARMGTEKSAAAKSMDEFLTNITLGVPIDPNSTDMKRGANEYFKQTGAADLLKSSNPEEFARGMRGVQTMALNAGIIPEAAVQSLRGLKASGSEQQQIFAIQAIGELYNQQANATDAAFTAGEIAEGISYQFKVTAGVDPKVAYQAILKEREAAREPAGATSLTKARLTEARKLAADMGLRDALRSPDRGGFLGMFKSNNISGGDLAERQILADYQQAFQTYYLISGDENLAKEQADAVLKRTVGISRTNGNRVMLHPPEASYPDMRSDWMRDSLQRAISEKMNMNVPSSAIELISDIETARAVRYKETPTYKVNVRTGGSVETLNDRWSFDAEATAEFERQKAAAKARDRRIAARQGAVLNAERTVDALEGVFVPTSLMTPDQVERVRKTQRDAKEQADILRQRAEAE